MAGPNKVNLSRLSYVVYSHPDVGKFEEFSKDFGFEPAGTSQGGDVFFRGYGLDPYCYVARQALAGKDKKFHGAGFIAQSSEDFDRACNLQGAQVTDISQRPGGEMVSVPDPNGYVIQVVYGQEDQPVPGRGVSNVFDGQPNVNGATQRAARVSTRPLGVFNRMDSGPAKVHKLGHFGYITDNYTESCAWYSSHFNFKPTDIVHKPGNPSAELMSFLHLDIGAEYSDHHCLLLATHHGNSTGTNVHHASFEVEDLDTEMMGHQWLNQKGYRSMWDVGRHVMGSQIFDYWYDTTGFIVEHYANGDVVNQDTPTCRSGGTPAAIWGPPLPTTWG